MGPAALCREIQSHISEPFWHMHCTLRTPDSKSCEFQWERGRLFDHTAAVILYEMCMEDPTATVLKVSHTSSGEWLDRVRWQGGRQTRCSSS